jgi:hypothetical protein
MSSIAAFFLSNNAKISYNCYSASSERKLLLHKLMCIVLCCCRDSLI